jgi:hypothetical protein
MAIRLLCCVVFMLAAAPVRAARSLNVITSQTSEDPMYKARPRTSMFLHSKSVATKQRDHGHPCFFATKDVHVSSQ